MARPTKLTPELQERMCEIISKGHSVVTACALCRISEKAYYQWKEKGEDGPDTIYGEFVQAIKKAAAEAKQELLQYAKDAAPKNWQAAMTVLERRWPNEFGRRDRISVQAHIGPMIEQVAIPPRSRIETEEPKQIEGGK